MAVGIGGSADWSPVPRSAMTCLRRLFLGVEKGGAAMALFSRSKISHEFFKGTFWLPRDTKTCVFWLVSSVSSILIYFISPCLLVCDGDDKIGIRFLELSWVIIAMSMDISYFSFYIIYRVFHGYHLIFPISIMFIVIYNSWGSQCRYLIQINVYPLAS
jgi:hypothetical protein